MTLRFTTTATDGAARCGLVETPRGRFTTPCFMPVGTRGSVKGLSSADLEALGVEVTLANAYHLMLRPGAEVVAGMGGIHRFTAWSGHVLTDSGGYQVLSLAARVDDDGVTFRSTYDGSTHRLTPERAVAVQGLLGADIQMALDVCPPLSSPPGLLRQAVERTVAWGVRARDAHRREGREGQALFGIVQGGIDERLRAESARRTVELDLSGYAIGGLSVGESRSEMLAALAPTVAELPGDRPRYLMGVGDPVGLAEAVALGADMFDCVLPTRLARHGTALTAAGPLRLRNATFAQDAEPIDPTCPCDVCGRWSRAYLRHQLVVGEASARRLITMHNLAWILALVARIRAAVRAGTLTALRAELANRWAHLPAASQ
ncbi:MAG: tRNA guanosine(34) transglycosylase Tgt [Actinobacteria bacterium]|nr:MAG: tRNA guanosine(34) transglycosylase Tgt [Actinomycetota bacterium]